MTTTSQRLSYAEISILKRARRVTRRSYAPANMKINTWRRLKGASLKTSSVKDRRTSIASWPRMAASILFSCKSAARYRPSLPGNCSRMTIITAVYPITPAIASNSSQAGNAAMRGSEAAGWNLIPGPLQMRMGILHSRGLILTANRHREYAGMSTQRM